MDCPAAAAIVRKLSIDNSAAPICQWRVAPIPWTAIPPARPSGRPGRREDSQREIHVFLAEISQKALVRPLVLAWFRQRADVVFQELFDEVAARAERHGITAASFELRRMKNRWGSCTPEGRNLLNPDLIIAPKSCIVYVIVHELFHLKEHNHGPGFYRLLQAVMPDWEDRRKRLNKCVVS